MGLLVQCGTFWGSHGCDKGAGHVEAGDREHVCGLSDPEGPCSVAVAVDREPSNERESVPARVAFYIWDMRGSHGVTLGEFKDGWSLFK